MAYSYMPLLALIGFLAGSTSATSETLEPTSVFDWEKLEPVSSVLKWTECGVNRQCARLELPLNYADLENTAMAVIAIMRIPSKLIGTAKYRGPILLNPGGPGASGVDFVDSYPQLSTVVGPEFDLVGFDPRGVARTRPRVSFYESCEERQLWESGTVALNSSSNAFARNYALFRLKNIKVHDRSTDEDHLRYLTTDLVARDMLEITRAMGFEKIKYWGFSYGSLLGATFAALFPDKIERLIIDGVMDADNYYDALWDNGLVDADKALGYFFTDCAEAGPETCAFHAETAQLVESKLNALLESLHKTPVPAIIRPTDGTKAMYGLVDYAMLRIVILTALSSPVIFPQFAIALEELRNGDGSAIFAMAGGSPKECGCDPATFSVSNRESSQAIMCTDAAPVEESLDELKERYELLWDTVSTFSELWTARLQCSGWKIRSPNRFSGPFIGNTSHPLLLIGNTADPMTPLSSAHTMAQGFHGAIVLTQDSLGHCSPSGVSICTARYVRAYFANGTLPKAGTVCPIDTERFPRKSSELHDDDDNAQSSLLQVVGNEEDRKLFEALKAVNERFEIVVQI